MLIRISFNYQCFGLSVFVPAFNAFGLAFSRQQRHDNETPPIIPFSQWNSGAYQQRKETNNNQNDTYHAASQSRRLPIQQTLTATQMEQEHTPNDWQKNIYIVLG